ncbi:hypothetical protein JL722_1975 [Aureococcus anophagefferens]|nr:hypothetical protein JL722_1975 [Aureococcus anophagefferens]
MPGLGEQFEVLVRWLPAEEQASDDGLLKPVTFRETAGKTVKHYADQAFDTNFNEHGGDAREFSSELVAYRGPLDGDAAEDGAAVALDDVVAEPSRLTLRPRVPEAGAVLLVAYQNSQQMFYDLVDLPVAEFGALSCHDVASSQDVELVKDEADYDADRFVPVDASASVSEIRGADVAAADVAVDDSARRVAELELAEPPDDLLCPISFEIMKDPVMADDGNTYEPVCKSTTGLAKPL